MVRWQVLQNHSTTAGPSGVYNRSMPNRGNLLRQLIVPAVLLAAFAAAALAHPMTKINIVVKNQSGKPVERASVVVKFVQGHSIVKLGKAVRTTFELRTNQDGEARIPAIPQGKIQVQIIAKGFQTFGRIFDVTDEEKTLDITLNPPQQQYSAH